MFEIGYLKCVFDYLFFLDDIFKVIWKSNVVVVVMGFCVIKCKVGVIEKFLGCSFGFWLGSKVEWIVYSDRCCVERGYFLNFVVDMVSLVSSFYWIEFDK